jgi:hypothetical protein
MQYGRKILVISKGYIPRIRVHNLIRDLNYHFIFHNDQQRNNAIEKLNLHKCRTHVANTPEIGQASAAFNREWSERNLIDLNEWYVWIDDNVSHFTWLPRPWYDLERIDFDLDWKHPDGRELMKQASYDWHHIYDTICPIRQILEIWEELIEKCEEENTVFGGLCINNNYFFRAKKWGHITRICTANAVAKNVGLPFRYWPECMIEDMARSIDVVARYGKVVVNKYVKPIKQFYEPGGIGSLQERIPNLEHASEVLMKMYPGLIEYTKGEKHQLSFKYKTQKTVDQWRREHGYL